MSGESTIPDPDAPRPGVLPTMLAGRYRMGPELARGAMGVVHTAHDITLDREVAIKIATSSGAHRQARFAREVRITAALQHPAIVPIHDTGRLSDGRPYYAMKVVRGRTLAALIEAAAGLNERLALVPHVLTICEAVAYAHTRRVLHRDLKPDNVLVGDFGEVIVIDWGLARQLEEQDPGDPSEDPTIEGDETLTVTGGILGTPAYMAPEQAEGRTVDERADVYALGAILYHVLAGQPPYRDARAGEVIARVVAMPPRRLGEVCPQVPKDLTAVVQKAMGRLPEDRYSTSAGLAADLRRFTTGQLVEAHRYSPVHRLIRAIRRHRVAFTVGAVASTLLVGGGIFAIQRILVERDVAQAERDAAAEARERVTRQRDAAESLVAFVLDDLRDRLEALGRIGLLEDAGARVLAYYDDASYDDRDARAGAHRAEALLLVGQLEVRLGASTSAWDKLQRAKELGIESEAWSTAARAAEALAAQHSDLGDVDEALAGLREMQELAERSGDLAVAVRAEIALAQHHQRVGSSELVRGHLDAALELARRFRTETGDAGIARLALAEATMLHGKELARAGDRTSGLAEIDDAIAMLPIDGPDAHDERVIALRCRLLTERARALAITGRIDDALPVATEATALAEAMVTKNPASVIAHEAVMTSRYVMGKLHMLRRDFEPALASYRQVAASAEQWAELEPDRVQTRRHLAEANELVAGPLLVLARYDDARELLEAAWTHIAWVAERLPHDPTVGMTKLRVAFGMLGVLAMSGDLVAAQRWAPISVEAADELERHRDHADVPGLQAQAYISAAQLLVDVGGHTAESRALGERAVKVLEARPQGAPNAADVETLAHAKAFAAGLDPEVDPTEEELGPGR